jgi:hypothetical protein
VAESPTSSFLAGGTTEVDLIRAGLSPSDHLVDINALPLSGVHDLPDGGLHIGALARMSDVRDDVVGPLGAKGVGEIGQVGVAAAIANAVFHATGRRVRELPIVPERVMDPPSMSNGP